MIVTYNNIIIIIQNLYNAVVFELYSLIPVGVVDTRVYLSSNELRELVGVAKSLI